METYILEIYEPDSEGSAVIATFESSTPFMTIQKGDIINPKGWSSYFCDSPNFPYGFVLRVTGVEHIIWQHVGLPVHHKLCVFTTAIKDDMSERTA